MDDDVRLDKREVDKGDVVPAGAGVDEVADVVVDVGVDSDETDSVDAGIPVKLNPCLRRSTTQSLLRTFEATSPSLPSFAKPST